MFLGHTVEQLFLILMIVGFMTWVFTPLVKQLIQELSKVYFTEREKHIKRILDLSRDKPNEEGDEQ